MRGPEWEEPKMTELNKLRKLNAFNPSTVLNRLETGYVRAVTVARGGTDRDNRRHGRIGLGE